jgi:type VI secretion system protein ImpE
MQEAKALFEAGQLEVAIQRLLADVKAKPTDIASRTFLFELCCFAGQWDRAQRQLDVIGTQDANAAIGVMAYRGNIDAERDRQKLFTEGLAPHFLIEPPPYIDLLLDAVNRIREGNYAEARAKLDEAEDARPAFSGFVNGEEFSDFRDYNDLTSSVIELIVKGQYTWLPIEQISTLEIVEPKNLRDLLWAPARIEAKDGTVGEVYIPTLYIGTSESQDDQVRLGHKTDWEELPEEIFRGMGLRLFYINGEDKPIFQLRQVEFHHEEETAAEEGAAGEAASG